MIVPTVLFLVLLLGVIVFAVDLGTVAHRRTELQRAANAAAHAGADSLVHGSPAAIAAAKVFYTMSSAGGSPLQADAATVEVGSWDAQTRTFSAAAPQPNAVRVTGRVDNQRLFFGKVLGNTAYDRTAQAIVAYLPRDIVLVLDYSGSMCYDSQFRNISLLGQQAVEDNLKQIWHELGSPVYGTNMEFSPVLSSRESRAQIKNQFNMRDDAYPYPGGSWDDYIDYVQENAYVKAAGYQDGYGLLTLVEYWQSQQTGIEKTPGMEDVSQQPLACLKDAVDAFLSYLTAHGADDRVGLSIYTYSDNKAILEHPLTNDYASISSITRKRQAGHYVGGTNISAGMATARVELTSQARPGAKKVMVLMTDGVVNLPSGNVTADKHAVINEANAAAAAKIPIVTIALGAYADTALMQQVADITGGACFVVAGGQPIAEVKAQLEAAFQKVAADRPLKLVQ